MSSNGEKKSRGRQKIEMKKMTNESNLQVTFSKRRSGLFKKASELCTLCGASVVLVVFSPGEKVFSFGHPHVDAVIDRYLRGGPPLDAGTMHQYIDAHRMANVHDLNAQLTHINNQLDIERKHAEELNGMKKEAEAQLWWARSIEALSMERLQLLKKAMEELKVQVAHYADMALLQSVANANPGPHFYPGASSSTNPNVVQYQPQPLLPPPQPQVFPQQIQMIQPPMLPNYMFPDGSMMNPNGTLMSPHGFNDMGMGGGYGGPATGGGGGGGFF